MNQSYHIFGNKIYEPSQPSQEVRQEDQGGIEPRPKKQKKYLKKNKKNP